MMCLIYVLFLAFILLSILWIFLNLGNIFILASRFLWLSVFSVWSSHKCVLTFGRDLTIFYFGFDLSVFDLSVFNVSIDPDASSDILLSSVSILLIIPSKGILCAAYDNLLSLAFLFCFLMLLSHCTSDLNWCLPYLL